MEKKKSRRLASLPSLNQLHVDRSTTKFASPPCPLSQNATRVGCLAARPRDLTGCPSPPHITQAPTAQIHTPPNRPVSLSHTHLFFFFLQSLHAFPCQGLTTHTHHLNPWQGTFHSTPSSLSPPPKPPSTWASKQSAITRKVGCGLVFHLLFPLPTFFSLPLDYEYPISLPPPYLVFSGCLKNRIILTQRSYNTSFTRYILLPPKTWSPPGPPR